MKTMKKIPKFKDEAEEREFWANADSSEYMDWSKAGKIILPRLVYRAGEGGVMRRSIIR